VKRSFVHKSTSAVRAEPALFKLARFSLRGCLFDLPLRLSNEGLLFPSPHHYTFSPMGGARSSFIAHIEHMHHARMTGNSSIVVETLWNPYLLAYQVSATVAPA